MAGLIFFFIFLALSIVFDIGDQLGIGEHLTSSPASCDSVQADATPPFYEAIYPLFTNLLGKSSSGEVSVVYIPIDLVEVQQNLCKGRTYIAALISVLASQHPSAIVIDKYFSSKSCTSEDETADTKRLLTAAQTAGVPIIVGEATDIAQEEEDESCLVENKSALDFNAPNVTSGVLRLNANREQIPLYWRVLDRQPPGAKHARKQSLSLTTAFAVPLLVEHGDRLNAVLKETRQPYSRLAFDLKSRPSTDLLCFAGEPDCASTSPRGTPTLKSGGTTASSDLEGKIVLIGSQNEVDHWKVLGKHPWGYELQAEYIDALLSGRYFRAAPGNLIAVIWITFLVLLEGGPLVGKWWMSRDHGKGMTQRKPVIPWYWRPVGWIPLFVLSSVALVLVSFLLAHCLPPLLMLSAMLIALPVRLVFLGIGWSEETILHHKEPLP